MATTQQLRKELAFSLGFSTYPKSKLAEPYLNYIENRHSSLGTLDEYLFLFRKVVEIFSGVNASSVSIACYLDQLCDSPEPLFEHIKGNASRKEVVEDTVLYIIGVWLIALSYFTKWGGHRQIELAYRLRHGRDAGPRRALEQTLPKLMVGSGLIPSSETVPSVSGLPQLPQHLGAAALPCNSDIHRLQFSRLESLESTSINATSSNAYTLSSLGDTRIFWTENFSRHLLLTPLHGQYVLEVFALPCALSGGGALFKAGIPATLVDEIQASYSILFNPYGGPARHARLGKALGDRRWCWCRPCSAQRLMLQELNVLRGNVPNRRRNGAGRETKSEFDPFLEELMSKVELDE
jgi:hypothetical protein